jgi:hypothetical protein
MALTFTDITAPVGIRNGQTTMPNKPSDLAIVTDLFDRMKRLILDLHNGFKAVHESSPQVPGRNDLRLGQG